MRVCGRDTTRVGVDAVKGKRVEVEGDAAIRELVRELACECPFDGSNPEECPLFLLRQRPVHERASALGALPMPSLEQLVLRHWRCFLRKLEEIHSVPSA